MKKGPPVEKKSFSEIANEKKSQSLVGDIVFLLKNNKKWWLVPFIVVFSLMAALIFLSGTGAAPFIYTLF